MLLGRLGEVDLISLGTPFPCVPIGNEPCLLPKRRCKLHLLYACHDTCTKCELYTRHFVSKLRQRLQHTAAKEVKTNLDDERRHLGLSERRVSAGCQ